MAIGIIGIEGGRHQDGVTDHVRPQRSGLSVLRLLLRLFHMIRNLLHSIFQVLFKTFFASLPFQCLLRPASTTIRIFLLLQLLLLLKSGHLFQPRRLDGFQTVVVHFRGLFDPNDFILDVNAWTAKHTKRFHICYEIRVSVYSLIVRDLN